MINNFLLQINMASESAEAAAETAEQMPTEVKISILELIAGGGWYIMIPLGILSVIAIYIFIERFLAIRKVEKED